MKKLSSLVVLLFMLLANESVVAQSARTLFMAMPDSLMPLLSASEREYCLDFIDAGMRARVTNRLDGKSELTKLTDDYIHLKTSESSAMQIKLLPTDGGDTILCIVNTVCAEACDSRIAFYDRGWLRLASDSLFIRPEISDFFHASDTIEDVMEMCDIYLVELSLSHEAPTLTARYTMPAYMSQDDSVRVSRCLHELNYKWNGRRFVVE